MTTAPYIDGTGTPRQRALTATSAGTVDDPDVAHFALDYSEESPITGATIPAGGIGIIGWLSGIWKFLNDRLTTLGQKTKAGSIPVTIASDQGSQLTTATLGFEGTQIKKYPAILDVSDTGSFWAAQAIGWEILRQSRGS